MDDVQADTVASSSVPMPQNSAPAPGVAASEPESAAENSDLSPSAPGDIGANKENTEGASNGTESKREDDVRAILEENRKRYDVLSSGLGVEPGTEWSRADTRRISELSARLLREEYESGGNNRRLDLIVDKDGREYLVNAPVFTYNNLQKLFKTVSPEKKQMLSDSHSLEEFQNARLTLTSADGLSTVTVLENGDIKIY